MKYLIFPLFFLTHFVGYNQSNLGSIDNVNKFLQEITPKIVNSPINTNITVNGEKPIHCIAYKYLYKRNGDIKDSSLYKVTKWNSDGTLSMITEYTSKKEIWNIAKYIYEKNGSDSTITIVNGMFGSKKYYLNQANQTYKFESFYDTNFRKIKCRHLYYYDREGNFLNAVITYPSSSESEHKWNWTFNPENSTAQITVNGNFYSTIRLNIDSCFIEEEYYKGGNPQRTVYYFDYLGNNCQVIDSYKTKKGSKCSSIFYERNLDGKIIRTFGNDFITGEVIDFKSTYDKNGLLIKEVYDNERKSMNYYYSYKK